MANDIDFLRDNLNFFARVSAYYWAKFPTAGAALLFFG